MKGRRSKHDRPQASAPAGPIRPPAPPARPDDLATTEQPVVPAGEVEPSAQVIDELLSFFGVRHGSKPPPPPGVPSPVAAPPTSPDDSSARLVPDRRPAPAGPPPAQASVGAPAPTSAETRIVGADGLAPAPVLPPGPDDDLVPSPTRRSTRRSVREAKREQKRADKRLAQHAKIAKKAEQQAAHDAKADAKAAAKMARKGGGAAPSAATIDDTGGEGVRIVPASPPTGGPGAPVAPPAVATAATADSPALAPASGLGAGTDGRATVTIVDDGGLPDALYLEGDLSGEGGARATVFIDDKDPATGSMVSLETATSAARMEPRMRERRIAVKRAVGRKRLKWVAIALAVVGAVVAVLAVAGSDLFQIKDITIDGAVYSRGDRLDAVIAELEGANVLRIDTNEIERQLEAIPWVADARVTTNFPNGATVEIAERRPVVAYQGTDGQYRVLDEHGRVLAVLAGEPVSYLVLDTETGEGPNLDAGAFAPPGYQSAARLVPALDDGLRAQVSAISAAADGSDLRLTLNGAIEVRFGAAEDLRDKLVRLQTALTDTDPENAPTELIDVSTRDIVVR